MGSDNEVLDERGLPVMDPKQKGTGSLTMPIGIVIVTTAISLAAAFAIDKYVDLGSASIKIAGIKSLDQQWIYLSAWLFSKVVQLLNMIPTAFKDKIMTSKSGKLPLKSISINTS
jgi:hypothetical protein